MHIQIIKPSIFLSRYIRHFWMLEADKSDGVVSERVVPNGSVELMFHYRNPFKSILSDNIEEKQTQSFLSGISSSYADVSTRGESGMIAVTFYPYGACNFFRFPMNEIENRNVDLRYLIGKESEVIEQKLYYASSLEERIRIIESFLLKQFSEVRTDDLKLICRAVSLINQNKGQLHSINLSDSLAITPKNLERKFNSLVGKSPKQFSKIVRFQSIVDSVSKGQNNSLTQVAYENGYYDQSHFIKDFKAFSGLTPIEFFRYFPCPSDYFN